jgi:hypothetical protein
VATAITHHVDNLTQLRTEDLPGWLTGLGVPAGWRLARFGGTGVQPSRIAVCGRQTHDGGDACETISVFGFTGILPVEAVHDNADRTLRDLHAGDITTQSLAAPPLPGVTAVRSSGYFNTAGLRVWGQYSTYVASSTEPGQGRLILHSVYVGSGCRATLTTDITQLTDSVHHAFLTALKTS